MKAHIDRAALLRLDAEVEDALRTGDESTLRVLGFGEISLVLGWPADEPGLAVKRSPATTDEPARAYADLFDRYLKELAERGVDVVDTELMRIDRDDGSVVLYSIQELLDSATLATEFLKTASPADVARVFEGVRDATLAVCDPILGLDSQISNWAVQDGHLRYFDVTTPFMADADGCPLLDVEPFLKALPAVLRPALRRFVLPDVIARYHRGRDVLLDFVANLQRFGFADLQPAALEVVNQKIDPPVGLDEARRYYKSDARLWSFMLRVRRLDRGWQRHVRRRPYPFLLPRESER
ncbi:MAG: hypothetical protein HYU28_04905 [Actinobacteria bacterium]|nr:hypothetical protein [Actinomycetota bacterium]